MIVLLEDDVYIGFELILLKSLFKITDESLNSREELLPALCVLCLIFVPPSV